MSLSIANHSASLPVAYRLYLPQEWTKDRARRKKVGVPKEIKFKTKPENALEQIRWACEAGLPRGVGLMNAAYGRDARLRSGMTELGVPYVAGIVPTILMWAPGSGLRRIDKPMTNIGRRDEPDLVSAKKVALGLPKQAWRTVSWREGSADRLSSRFARVRVRIGYNKLIPETLSPEWLLIRMARGRSRADQILALQPAGDRQLRAARRSCQAALAHRAQLSGPRSAAPVQVPPLPETYRPRGSARAA
ncbi:SRSO17 transposase [Bradyrhizobium sp. USDA 4532]|nr:SRSO17 transposase [Bradyrhizobium sp. USDA 4545]MCP1920262.1 SRSO17 transposase [Bradyrhizobium sp. USDA 4532]